MRKSVIAAALLGTVFAAASANAAVNVSISSTALQVNANPGAGTLIDFDSALPTGFTGTGTNFVIQSGSNSLGAAPANDTTKYLSVLGGGSYTLSSAKGFTDVSLYWGSIDTYNTLSLLDANGNVLKSIGYTDIDSAGTGNQINGNSNRRVDIASNTAFYGIKLTSSSNSFEADNIKFSGAVPEPTSWAMMVGGFGLLGGAMRRRKVANVSFA